MVLVVLPRITDEKSCGATENRSYLSRESSERPRPVAWRRRTRPRSCGALSNSKSGSFGA